MNNPTRVALPLLAFILLASPVFAAPAAMKIPVNLKDVEPQPVTGRTGALWKNQLSFAEWQATAPGTFDASGWTLGTRSASGRDRETVVGVERVAFEFELRSANSALAGMNQCLVRGRFLKHTEIRGRVTDETTLEPPGYPRIDCRLAGPVPAELSLRRTAMSQRDSGTLRSGEREWTVRSVHNLATQRSSFPMGRFGFEISTGDAAVAAVETLNAGRVWIRPDISAAERAALGAAIAALLNYSVLLEMQDD
jgi:hypothetical protein